ncbi:MAG TPA: DUF3499 family protein [Acidimicrobiales bacterium]|nr:DUF3499 family protein [Acidimicrobiales bacterium]
MAGSSRPAALGRHHGPPPDTLRRCARPGCSAEASATMTYGYRARTAWIDDLLDDAGGGYDLCEHHADGLGVPVGWTRTDRRSLAGPSFTAVAV